MNSNYRLQDFIVPLSDWDRGPSFEFCSQIVVNHKLPTNSFNCKPLHRKHDTDNNLKLDGLELLKAIAGMDGQ